MVSVTTSPSRFTSIAKDGLNSAKTCLRLQPRGNNTVPLFCVRDHLIAHDELERELNAERILVGFRSLRPRFPPTFKVCPSVRAVHVSFDVSFARCNAVRCGRAVFGVIYTVCIALVNYGTQIFHGETALTHIDTAERKAQPQS